jgi:hypothetical protein
MNRSLSNNMPKNYENTVKNKEDPYKPVDK